MKNVVAILIAILIIGAAIFVIGSTDSPTATPEGEDEQVEDVTNQEMRDFVDCLAENDFVIFGASWCPACGQLAESFGGYDIIEPIYVECTEEGTVEERERCENETKMAYVPEIQIAGEVYEGSRDLNVLGDQVGCEL